MPSYTTDTLVARIKRKCQLATTVDGNAKLTDAEILEIADEEVQTRLYAALMQVRDDYFVDFRHVIVQANQRWIQLPTYVASSTLLDVGWVDTSDNNRVRKLVRVFSGAAHYDAPQPASTPSAYVVEGDRLGLVTPSDAACELVLRYERRPNRMHLAADEKSSAIVSYDPALLTFVLTSPTATLTTNLAIGTIVDLVRATPPLGVAVQGLQVDAIASPTWTLAVGDVDHSEPETFSITTQQINAGDYVSVSGETPVFPLPDVWWPAAIMAASATVCREIGDMEQSAANDQAAQALIAQAQGLQTNRARKQAHVFVNGASPLRVGPWGGNRVSQNQWGWRGY